MSPGMNPDKSTLTAGFDPERVISEALKRGGDFADIYLEDSSLTSVLCEEDRIEKVLSSRDRGAGVRVIADNKTYYAYTNDISEEGLLKVAATVAGGVGGGGTLGDMNLMSSNVASLPVIMNPRDTDLATKVAIVSSANRVARAYDDRVKQVRVTYGDSFKGVAVINSLGEWVEEERTGIVFLCHVVSSEGELIQTGYEPLGGALGLEVFDETPPEEVARRAAALSVNMLSARRAPGGRFPVVLASEAGGTMIHEAVGHGLEADLAEEDLSVYSGRIGEVVASPKITVIDDGTIARKRGTSIYDGEGTPTSKTTLIDGGVLKNYMRDRLSAMKSGTESTGNGRRESYQHRPIVRMTNTLIAPGGDDPSTIVPSVDKGLYVKRMGGGQVNTVNGDFVFEVSEGYMIEGGKIGELVRGATLTGNGPEVLMAIDMVGTDLGYGIGTCGKDGQGVPVSDAQPTLRIPEIVVGGAAA